jgi:uncharacterized protein (TIGR02391 family)
MKASELREALESFRDLLTEHQKLWASSLDQPIPDYPVRNTRELEAQSKELCRQLGRLQAYILRFRTEWVLQHPAIGTAWNALDAAVGLNSVAQAKGPSLQVAIQGVDQVIGQVEALDPDDIVPTDSDAPVRSGSTVDKIMLAYVQSMHPHVIKSTSGLFHDGHYPQAVEESVKAVLQYIRDKTGLTSDGAALIDTAFSLKSPLLAFSDLSDKTKQNEQLGFMSLLKGFLQGVRHPLAHSQGRQEDVQKAFEYLVMASLFCRRIDDASPGTLNI